MSIVVSGVGAVPSHNIAEIRIIRRSDFEDFDLGVSERWVVVITSKSDSNGFTRIVETFFFKSSAHDFAAKAMRDHATKELHWLTVSILTLAISVLVSVIYLVKGGAA